MNKIIVTLLLLAASVCGQTKFVLGDSTTHGGYYAGANWKLTQNRNSVCQVSGTIDSFYVYYGSETSATNYLKIGIYKRDSGSWVLLWQDSLMNRTAGAWNRKLVTNVSVVTGDTIHASIVTHGTNPPEIAYASYTGTNWYALSSGEFGADFSGEMVDPHQAVTEKTTRISIYLVGTEGEECSTPTGTNPSNRVDTIGQSGKFALVHDGCEPDSFRFINKGSLDSVVLVATKDSVAYRLKNLQKTVVPCSLSLWYGGAAVDTVIWTWRVTGPSATAYRDTLKVNIDDTTGQTVEDSLCDSMTYASPFIDSVYMIKTGTGIGNYRFKLKNTGLFYPKRYAWRGGIAADSATDTLFGLWVQPTLDSCKNISGGSLNGSDSCYELDSMRLYYQNGSTGTNVDSIKIGDSTAVHFNENIGYFDFRVPDNIGVGFVQIILYDTTGASDTLDSAFYCLGEAPVPPDTFTVTISITGNHLTEPDIDTTPFTVDGRYETGTEITITATQAALHKLIPTATFPASPLVFTITRDTTIIIQSDTFPKFTRDTIIAGGHATVAVAPVTLTPVDSATACTTSVTAVDEGWRVDSIVHYSGGVRTSAVTYPATQITYLIVANTIDSIFTSEIPAVQYTLTMDTSGSGTVTPSAGDTVVDSGAGIPITATPGIGYTFTGWTTVSGTILFNADSSRCSLSTAATLRANFTIKTYTITGTDVGNGTHGFIPENDSVIDSNSTGRIYAVYGDSVVFNGFSDDTAGGVRAGDTLTVTMHADRAITLTFTDIPDSSGISFSQPDNGTITIDPAALRRAAGDTTEIVFTADDHYHFGGWTGGLADSTNDTVNYVFPATGKMTFSATSYIDTHTVTPINGDNMALIPMMPLQVEYGSPCSLVVGCEPGYLWRVNAGPWNNTQLDTFVITVISDTVLTGESYLIPTDARSVVISPASLTIDTGLTRQFTATYYDTIGRVADPQPVTTWASTIGSVGPTGLFSSGTEIGTGIVRGYNGSIADTSNVTVRYSSGGAMVNRWNSFNGAFRMAWRRFR